MGYTHDIAELVDQLRTDAQLQNTYRNNPGAAIGSYHVTPHERDAFVTRDVDDFVAIGLVNSIWQLPEVMTGPRPGGLTGLLLGIKLTLDDRFKLRIPIPEPPLPHPRPDPGPMPDPGPIPHPKPRPGPDPPPPGF